MMTCKKCMAERSRKWREENPGKHYEINRKWIRKNPDRDRFWNAKKNYGISEDHYLQLRSKHLCAIYKQTETKTKTNRGKVRLLNIDHNHHTGQIRDVLCCDCNLMIGRAKENVAILREAIFYLEKWEGQNEREQLEYTL